MKLIFFIVTLFLNQLLAGCSHVRTISILTPVSEERAGAPVDFTGFWRENEFTLVDPTSDIGKLCCQSDEGRVVAVWEKRYKGIVFKYSGGMWATEKILNNHHEIIFLPVSSSSDAAADEMARNLKEYIDRNHPDLRVEITSKAFIDFR